MDSSAGYILLSDGSSIPQIGFGCYASHGTEISRAVTWALECGYRFIDSAAMYANEADVGIGLKESQVERESYYLLSKVWPTHFEHVTASVEQSLRDLRVDYLDSCLLHWPGTNEYSRLSAYEQLLNIQERGLIRAAAVSNFQIDQLQTLKKYFGAFPPINQIELHPAYQQLKLRQFCLDSNIALIAYSPIKRGAFMADPTICSIARKYQKSPNQIVLRWHVQRNQIPIPKSSHYKRIHENYDVFDFSLTDNEIQRINALECGGRRGYDPLTFNGEM